MHNELQRDRVESNDDFIFHVQLGTLDDYYLFEHKSKSKRTRRSAVHHEILKNHVLWFEQQKVRSRKKRDLTLSAPLFGYGQWYIKNAGKKF